MKDGFTGERSIVLPQMTVEKEQQDPLVSSLYITDIGYYPHADGHFRERLEPISQYVLIYCMEGEGWFRVGTKEQRIRGGQYVVLPAGQPHAYGADRQRPWTIYWIHFRGAHASIYAEDAVTPHDITPAQNSRISERNHIFEEIFSTLSRGTDCESLRYASSLLHYYLASMRYLHHYRTEAPASNDLVAATRHYMQENLEKRLALADLARYTGYSPSHFSVLFRKETGCSPLAYFNRMKMERACQLLSTTDMRVNQICHVVGITDCYYFSRLFSLHTGQSPTQYREAHYSKSSSTGQ